MFEILAAMLVGSEWHITSVLRKRRSFKDYKDIGESMIIVSNGSGSTIRLKYSLDMNIFSTLNILQYHY